MPNRLYKHLFERIIPRLSGAASKNGLRSMTSVSGHLHLGRPQRRNNFHESGDLERFAKQAVDSLRSGRSRIAQRFIAGIITANES